MNEPEFKRHKWFTNELELEQVFKKERVEARSNKFIQNRPEDIELQKVRFQEFTSIYDRLKIAVIL